VDKSTIALLLFIGVIISLLNVFIYTVAHKDEKDLQRSGSFALMSAVYDMQGRDKQNAIETVKGLQAEKIWKEQGSGEGNSDMDIPSE
jgi:predicted negative regulator of RcsB-dependent stress response